MHRECVPDTGPTSLGGSPYGQSAKPLPAPDREMKGCGPAAHGRDQGWPVPPAVAERIPALPRAVPGLDRDGVDLGECNGCACAAEQHPSLDRLIGETPQARVTLQRPHVFRVTHLRRGRISARKAAQCPPDPPRKQGIFAGRFAPLQSAQLWTCAFSSIHAKRSHIALTSRLARYGFSAGEEDHSSPSSSSIPSGGSRRRRRPANGSPSPRRSSWRTSSASSASAAASAPAP
jgi:hypothetical protein